MRRIIGSPATGIAGLARTSVSGRSRVPRPAVSTSAWRCSVGRRRSVSSKQHVGRSAGRGARQSTHEQARGTSRARSRPVRGRAPLRRRRCRVAAFDLDEGPDRRLVERDDDVVEREFLAILLIPEPARGSRAASSTRSTSEPSPTHGLELLAQLHLRRLHRALEGEQAPAAIPCARAARSRSRRSSSSAVSSRQSPGGERPGVAEHRSAGCSGAPP